MPSAPFSMPAGMSCIILSRHIEVRIRPAWVTRFELRCDAGSPLGAPLAIWARGRLRSGNSPAPAEKIILPGDRDHLGCVTEIRVPATCQRDEFSLCTSKFESDHPSHAVGLADVLAAIAPHRTSPA